MSWEWKDDVHTVYQTQKDECLLLGYIMSHICTIFYYIPVHTCIHTYMHIHPYIYKIYKYNTYIWNKKTCHHVIWGSNHVGTPFLFWRPRFFKPMGSQDPVFLIHSENTDCYDGCMLWACDHVRRRSKIEGMRRGEGNWRKRHKRVDMTSQVAFQALGQVTMISGYFLSFFFLHTEAFF